MALLSNQISWTVMQGDTWTEKIKNNPEISAFLQNNVYM
jgi:hypothetical protein